MSRKAAISPGVKQAIVADRSAGMKVDEIASKYGLHRVSVSRVISQFKREVPQSVLASPTGDYRERLKGKAIKAVEIGLDCPVDPYKAGNLGVATLRGIGEWSGDERQTGITITISPFPKGLEPESLDLFPEATMSPDPVASLPDEAEGSRPEEE